MVLFMNYIVLETYGCVIYHESVKHSVIHLHTTFMRSKSRLSPLKSTTLPQLCIQAIVPVVLAYICNEERHIFIYVLNRVQGILSTGIT